MNYTDPDEAYWQHQYQCWMDKVDEAMTDVIPLLKLIPRHTLNLPAIKETIEIAHEADDPDWHFNGDQLVTELMRLASPTDIDWSDMQDLHDFIYEGLEELFPLAMA